MDKLQHDERSSQGLLDSILEALCKEERLFMTHDLCCPHNDREREEVFTKANRRSLSHLKQIIPDAGPGDASCEKCGHSLFEHATIRRSEHHMGDNPIAVNGPFLQFFVYYPNL